MLLEDDIRKARTRDGSGPWKAVQHDSGWWEVHDLEGKNMADDSGDGGLTEDTARRIAALPEIECRYLRLLKLSQRLFDALDDVKDDAEIVSPPGHAEALMAMEAFKAFMEEARAGKDLEETPEPS